MFCVLGGLVWFGLVIYLFFEGGGQMGLLSFFSAGELLVLLLTCMNGFQRASLEQCMHEF